MCFATAWKVSAKPHAPHLQQPAHITTAYDAKSFCLPVNTRQLCTKWLRQSKRYELHRCTRAFWQPQYPYNPSLLQNIILLKSPRTINCQLHFEHDPTLHKTETWSKTSHSGKKISRCSCRGITYFTLCFTHHYAILQFKHYTTGVESVILHFPPCHNNRKSVSSTGKC